MSLAICGWSDGYELNNKIIVFPNPSNGYIIVNSGEDMIDIIRIFDNTGRTVYNNSNVHSSYQNIELKEKSPGVYVIAIQIDNIWIRSKLIIE